MKKKILYLMCFIISALSCSDNEVQRLTKSTIGINSFEIKENNEQGVHTKTSLFFENANLSDITKHGIVWYKKSDTKPNYKYLDSLNNDFFEVSISNNLLKDSIYKTFSFIEIDESKIFSDTLNFKTLFTTPIIIDSIYPRKGFIGDTINIKGKNFCMTDFSSHIIINDNGVYKPIFESDSLIKLVIPSYIKKSSLKMSLKTCNITTPISDSFQIKLPILDSLESCEKYVGDKIKFYGKNLHSSISKVWFSDIEAQIIDTEYKDTLIAIVPDLLPVGKLDVKLKVLDRIIKKDNYFQSTTPYIKSVSPNPFGYLDTIFITGKYLKQKNNIPSIKVGGINQTYIQHNSDSIKVFINRYFSSEKPKLKFEVLNFSDEIDVNILAPKIIGFNKKTYDFTDDIIIRTDNFMNTSSIVIGNEKIGFEDNPTINDNGEVTLSLLRWLDLAFYYSSFTMTPIGQLEVRLNSSYGSDNKSIQINPPYISSINKPKFLAGEHIKLQGKNFGNQGVCKIYIDGNLVPNLHTSAYTLYNDNIDFELNTNTTVGSHTLYVEVAGQRSNIIKYEIKEVKVNSISKTNGTRKDIYVLKGENMERMSLLANDVSTEVIEITSNEVKFKLPYYKKIDGPIYIKGVSGDQNIFIGTINGIEPHDIKEDVTKNISYYGNHIAGDNGTDWYFVSHQGVHRFNHSVRLWENIDISSPPFSVSYVNLKHMTVTNDELILVHGNLIYTYDIALKSWSEKSLPFSVAKGILLGDKLFAMSYDNFEEFYEYNINTKQIIKYAKPTNSSLAFASITNGDNKVFISPIQGEAYYFDLLTKSFTLISKPNNRYSTYQSVALKYYKDQLYFIGGRTDEGIKHEIYVYDLNTRNWVEKTPLLFLSKEASIHIKNNMMYIGLGYSLYSYENDDLDIYDLNIEPY
ncbi:IPT/TIG domain-containing protein [Tenacibaculum ovolyticum]|uniref:IPT/TIG domain-containing protein n=1 Tax=Tenacibaculum ovolyticum TaxID=104270 RepID=UPI0022F3ACF8|nr:IPT/TIG domain-containing protein [Tenacibaculum ovolyticum]WBX78155.1 IPT/TIG domain-containing protein [Tenacibaculum ovolyticum]